MSLCMDVKSRYGSLYAMLVAACLASLASGCATQLTVARLKPAEINLRGVNRIAVYEVGGQDGPALESQLTQALFDSGRFEVLERTAIDKVMHEQGMSVDAAFQGGNLELGKMLPASAIVSGRVGNANYEENVERENVACRKTNNGKDYYDATCVSVTRTGKAAYSADLRVLDTNTGRILAAKSLRDERAVRTSAVDAEPASIDGKELVDQLRSNVVAQFLRVVAPYKVQEQVELVDDGELPEIEKGNQYLTRGDIPSALEHYGLAVSQGDTKASLDAEVKGKAHYALGLGLALVGDYPAALSQLKAANALCDEEDWLALEVRVRGWEKEAAAVADQQRSATESGPLTASK